MNIREKLSNETHGRRVLALCLALAFGFSAESQAWCNRWGCGGYATKTAANGTNYTRVTVCYYSGGCVQVRKNQSTGKFVKRGKK